MALYSINSATAAVEKSFTDIWDHYTKAGFLYEAKLERMKAFLDRTRNSVNALIQAPDDFFQMHIAEDESEIVSSLSGFRDTKTSFVIEHAVSNGRPELMIQCLLSMTTTLSNKGIDAVSMFYTPKNRWPSRLSQIFSGYYPEESISNVCFDYGTAHWEAPPPLPESISSAGISNRTREILSQWLSAARIEALDVENGANGEVWDFQVGHNLSRKQRIYHAYHEGVHIGCMIFLESPVVMNFSHLCTRAEIYVDRDHPGHQEAAQFLSSLAWRMAREAGREFFVLLMPAEAQLLASMRGYDCPGKRYSCFTWPSNGVRGFATTAIALCEWYGRCLARMQAYGRAA